MGDYHKSLKEFPSAVEKYERGLPKIRKFGIIALEYSLLENLGNSYLEISRFEKALICFRYSRSLRKKNADHFMEAKAVWNMSKICQETGESSEAINYAELASRICSGVQIDDDIKKLAEEIKGWMIKRVGDGIKDSGL
jgi:tetratricopeptide (TPR) repeat protein